MHGTGKRQKGKKHRRSGCGLASLLILLMLPGAACWYGCRLVPAEINAAVENFMKDVAAGDAEGASLFLLEEEGGEGLAFLIDLFQGNVFTYKGTGGCRLTGLFSGTALLYFSSSGSPHQAPLHLARRGGKWFISALPEIKIMTGALVEKCGTSTLQVFYRNERIDLPAPKGLKIEAGEVVQARLFGDAAVIERLERICLSRLLRIDDARCEGELEGDLPLKPSLEVYLVGPGFPSGAEQGSPGDLIVGMSDLELYRWAGKVVAAKVEKGFMPLTIRVLLRQDLDRLTAETLFHRQIRLRSKDSYTLDGRRSGALFAFEPGQSLFIEPWGEAVRVTPEGLDSVVFQHPIYLFANGGGAMIIENIQRQGWPGGKPAYRGTLEIANIDGKLAVINELDLEEYLCAVVPGEMPAAFGLEPLKAQAVAARTYALRSILGSRYSSCGAHLDDSVLSQVYNNVTEEAAATEAVMASRGEILFFGDQAADARYFSTSCGFTAGCHEVWPDPTAGYFPAEPVPYLKALSQIPGYTINPGSGEEEAAAFLEGRDWEGYDSSSPYFRWGVEMSGEQLTASLNHNLPRRYLEQPEYVLTKEGDSFVPMEIPRNPLGRLRDIRVIRRGAGGNIMILDVEGTNGTYRIMTEYNIRFTLRPVNYLAGGAPVILVRHDGSRLADCTILPSAFVCFNLERNDGGEITGVFLWGGGNGHGVGMSQYGARGMAEKGYDYRGILEHYYPGTELRRLDGSC